MAAYPIKNAKLTIDGLPIEPFEMPPAGDLTATGFMIAHPPYGDDGAQVKADLISARALIAEERHWKKGVLDDGSCYCAFGALRHVVRYRDSDQLTFIAGVLESFIEGHYPRRRQGIKDMGDFRLLIRFNDHPDVTHADVIAVFDRAIDSDLFKHA